MSSCLLISAKPQFFRFRAGKKGNGPLFCKNFFGFDEIFKSKVVITRGSLTADLKECRDKFPCILFAGA